MTPKQTSLFGGKHDSRPAKRVDPMNVPREDVPRLSKQCAAVLDRLRRGPATNWELAAISLKYTSRISDIRAAGYVVECDYGTGGVNTYRLTEDR